MIPLESETDRLIYHLYGLTSDEDAEVVKVPGRPVAEPSAEGILPTSLPSCSTPVY